MIWFYMTISLAYLILIFAPIRGSIFPSKTEFKSGNWMSVFTSCTSLFGWNTYLLVSCFHISAMASLLMPPTSGIPCSIAVTTSLAFRRLRALILFAKWLLSPAHQKLFFTSDLWENYQEKKNNIYKRKL